MEGWLYIKLKTEMIQCEHPLNGIGKSRKTHQSCTAQLFPFFLEGRTAWVQGCLGLGGQIFLILQFSPQAQMGITFLKTVMASIFTLLLKFFITEWGRWILFLRSTLRDCSCPGHANNLNCVVFIIWQAVFLPSYLPGLRCSLYLAKSSILS